MQTSASQRIQILPPLLVDRIAAGEVIEGPSSIVKELLENSLDAGAKNISIDTQSAGLMQIHVEDNGCGIHPLDLEASLTRYATSKIQTLTDLENLKSFGFRGEALAAISSVSVLHMKSRHLSEKTGFEILSRGGKIISKNPCSHEIGTSIKINDLFYSTPARRKFLKSERTENLKTHKEIIQLALAHPEAHIQYSRENKDFAIYPHCADLSEKIASIYGKELCKNLIEVHTEFEDCLIKGYISQADFHRSNRDYQFSFVNSRPIEIKNLSFLVRKAYDELLPQGSHPTYFLFFEMPTEKIDINVHPQKKEVRLVNQNLIQNFVLSTLRHLLRPKVSLSFESQKSKNFTRNFVKPDEKETQSFLLTDEFRNIRSYESHASKKFDFTLKNNEQENIQPKLYEPDQSKQSHSPNDIFEDSPSVGKQGSSHETLSRNKDDFFQFKRHYGIIFGTYILAEGEHSLYIVDQHTAHERINYEKYLRKLELSQTQRQILLHPLNITCMEDELLTILEKQNELEQNGFLIEPAGTKGYFVREVPHYIEAGVEAKILASVIQKIIEGETKLEVYKDYAAMRACKASIKRNDMVSPEHLTQILEDLSLCDDPSRCPHGRPTVIEITSKDLDKMFKRI